MDQEFIDKIIDTKILSFDVTEINTINKGPYLIDTLIIFFFISALKSKSADYHIV